MTTFAVDHEKPDAYLRELAPVLLTLLGAPESPATIMVSLTFLRSFRNAIVNQTANSLEGANLDCEGAYTRADYVALLRSLVAP